MKIFKNSWSKKDWISGYIDRIFNKNIEASEKPSSTAWDIEMTLSSIQDQFSFLLDNADAYKYQPWVIGSSESTYLASKYFVEDNNTWSESVYRGMWLSIDQIRDIYKEGLLLSKTQDDEHDEICFSVQSPYYSSKSISWAAQSNPDQFSFVFQISIDLLKEHKIRFFGSWDKFVVAQDIPADIIKQCTVFVVDYKTQDLVRISPR